MKCSHCGKVFFGRNLEKIDDKYVCEDCIRKYYKTCRNCGNYFLVKNEGDSSCDRCDSETYKNSINNYTTKPNLIFKNSKFKTEKDIGCRYYGLEMEYNDVDYTQVYRMLKPLYKEKFIYNKRDGSIGSGVEIVTAPLSKQSLSWLLKSMDSVLKDYISKRNYSRNAGLHIHVNRNSIDGIDIYKLNMLLNMNTLEYEQRILFYLAGRISLNEREIQECTRYCGCNQNKAHRIYRSSDRHIALNLNNKGTIEFRIFKSSTDIDVIKSYVEIVDMMVDFCHNNGVKNININNFIVYLKSKSKNKIILKRISDYEKEYGIIKQCDNILKKENIKTILDGIPIVSYYKILSLYNKQSIINSTEKYNGYRILKSIVSSYNSNKYKSFNCDIVKYFNSERQDNISEDIRSSIKENIIQKIMERIAKCA